MKADMKYSAGKILTKGYYFPLVFTNKNVEEISSLSQFIHKTNS